MASNNLILVKCFATIKTINNNDQKNKVEKNIHQLKTNSVVKAKKADNMQ